MIEFYHLAFPDTPSWTGSPGVECRTREYFYWGIKRKIKALGIRNLQCSISSRSSDESERESSSNTIITFIEEREQMVKILTSDLRISFLESHYPPLLVSASSRFFFNCLWKFTVQGSGCRTFWTSKLSGMHVQEFSMCVAISESHWWLSVL